MAKVAKTLVPQDFFELRKGLADDKNFCAAIALAALTGIDAVVVRDALEGAGRKRNCATYSYQMRTALNSFGFDMIQLDWREHAKIIESYPGVHRKLKHITTHRPRRFKKAWADKGNMLMITPDHAAALVDGEVVDWSINNSLRVIDLYRIVPIIPNA